jgi:hypothetical protein
MHWLYGLRYTNSSYRVVVHHGNVGNYNLVVSLSGYNPTLYFLAFTYIWIEKYLQSRSSIILCCLRHASGRVQLEQAVEATNVELGTLVDITRVQLLQSIHPLLSCRLPR